MQSVEYYRGREQTYLKHFILERYLERVAYNIGWGHPEFVYIDGFSGPWRSQHEALEDTSFMIAINKLRDVRRGLEQLGKRPRVRCLFIEKDPEAFRALERAVSGITDMEVRALHGEFEAHVETARAFAGTAFTLTFVDPTGWTGFGLRRITKLMHARGELLINVMWGHIGRFLDGDRKDLAATFDELFGGPGWESILDVEPARREEAAVRFYGERLRAIGSFPYVTSTRILQPLAERSYFYLVYATRHPKGLVEFRGVEEKFVDLQENLRAETRENARVERTGQPSLFAPAEIPAESCSYAETRAANYAEARSRVERRLAERGELPYEDALATALEVPLVWKRDVAEMVLAMRKEGAVAIAGMGPNERTPKREHTLKSLAGLSGAAGPLGS